MELEYLFTRKIRELAILITKSRDADIRELGLTTAQADVILYFAENPGKSIVDLKSFLGVTHQTARGIIQRMSDKGFLEIHSSSNDARYKQISLTEKAISVYNNMKKNGTRTGNQLLNGISPEEKEKFLWALNRGLENLGNGRKENH